MRGRLRLGGALIVSGAVAVTGCSASGSTAKGSSVTTSPSSAAPAGTSTPAPTPTPTPTQRRRLKPGGKGADVRGLQQRLKDLGYDPGTIDGRYGPTTQMAVWAFEKVNRIKVTSTLGKRFWAALDAPKTPQPIAKRHEPDRVDIDLRRQYLVVYKDGRPVLISHISSGSGEYYCAKDFGSNVPRCRYAGTSTGDFVTGRRASGWEKSPLGQLYNPVYFNGGIAVHGALDVPTYPASHGCVRIPMHAAEIFPTLVGSNVPVHVRRPK